VGWLFMDSVMLGSLHTYRRWILSVTGQESLSLFGHGVAGAMAGFTVSFVASPIEHIKARLQVQYSAMDRVYKGPMDAYRKIVCPLPPALFP
jgi:solute carrier family 25 (mitochondrial carnitine/acylcarnitine transporter), member 20/29